MRWRWLIGLTVVVLVVVGCSRSAGIVGELRDEAATLAPPDATELARTERDSVEVFAMSNQSGVVGVLWASERSVEELTAYYGSGESGGSFDVVDRRVRMELGAYTADLRIYRSVIIYREVPDSWPLFGSDEIDLPAGRTLVLVAADWALD